ncbi:hypothetical protein SAICODRAFT_28275 [Saitoella complicata NRRL Y-17804]|nr:uncharacterized protein SAICODRAFT_28275 [Saitoella complicata NRRL Y-17804]ODQ49598.1 hypothetical protein SAICODRAFT_28275 [Saitoella complicata NRRL Y-17804]
MPGDPVTSSLSSVDDHKEHVALWMQLTAYPASTARTGGHSHPAARGGGAIYAWASIVRLCDDASGNEEEVQFYDDVCLMEVLPEEYAFLRASVKGTRSPPRSPPESWLRMVGIGSGSGSVVDLRQMSPLSAVRERIEQQARQRRSPSLSPPTLPLSPSMEAGTQAGRFALHQSSYTRPTLGPRDPRIMVQRSTPTVSEVGTAMSEMEMDVSDEAIESRIRELREVQAQYEALKLRMKEEEGLVASELLGESSPSPSPAPGVIPQPEMSFAKHTALLAARTPSPRTLPPSLTPSPGPPPSEGLSVFLTSSQSHSPGSPSPGTTVHNPSPQPTLREEGQDADFLMSVRESRSPGPGSVVSGDDQSHLGYVSTGLVSPVEGPSPTTTSNYDSVLRYASSTEAGEEYFPPQFTGMNVPGEEDRGGGGHGLRQGGGGYSASHAFPSGMSPLQLQTYDQQYGRDPSLSPRSPEIFASPEMLSPLSGTYSKSSQSYPITPSTATAMQFSLPNSMSPGNSPSFSSPLYYSPTSEEFYKQGVEHPGRGSFGYQVTNPDLCTPEPDEPSPESSPPSMSAVNTRTSSSSPFSTELLPRGVPRCLPPLEPKHTIPPVPVPLADRRIDFAREYNMGIDPRTLVGRILTRITLRKIDTKDRHPTRTLQFSEGKDVEIRIRDYHTLQIDVPEIRIDGDLATELNNYGVTHSFKVQDCAYVLRTGMVYSKERKTMIPIEYIALLIQFHGRAMPVYIYALYSEWEEKMSGVVPSFYREFALTPAVIEKKGRRWSGFGRKKSDQGK